MPRPLAAARPIPHICGDDGGQPMAAIDYEAEYNNRARVPEHPQIFASWARDAQAFRAAMQAAGRAELGVAYGDSPRQILDLYAPDGAGNGAQALFVHGGYWRALDPATHGHLAHGLTTRGVAVAMAGYDLAPQVGIADIIDEMRQACLALWRRTRKRILAFGHSAGGHLTACLLATDWKSLDPSVPADLVPAGYAISGVFDLIPLVHTGMNADFRLNEQSARAISPLYWPVPGGRVLDAVVGGAESAEFLRQSETMAAAWSRAGATTRYEAVDGANHFTIIAPLSDPASAMVERLTVLAERVRPSLL